MPQPGKPPSSSDMSDHIQSRPLSAEGRENFDRIFRKKDRLTTHIAMIEAAYSAAEDAVIAGREERARQKYNELFE